MIQERTIDRAQLRDTLKRFGYAVAFGNFGGYKIIRNDPAGVVQFSGTALEIWEWLEKRGEV